MKQKLNFNDFKSVAREKFSQKQARNICNEKEYL